MEAADFGMPSPKRQKTESPKPENEGAPKTTTAVMAGDNDILDTLMQHVEEESMPQLPIVATEPLTEAAVVVTEKDEHSDHSLDTTQQHAAGLANNTGNVVKQEQQQDDKIHMTNDADVHNVSTTQSQDGHGQAETVSHEATQEQLHPAPQEHSASTTMSDVAVEQSLAAQIDGIPSTEGNGPNETAEGAEWEVDSSPYASSTEDSDSSDDDSSDDSDDEEDEDGDYAMLDPEEQARILMQGDAGSDDEGGTGKNRSGGAGYKTTNEQLEDVPVIPDIKINADMPIEELGLIEAIVENNILIRAKVSGEYQVLESGSLLCFKDRQAAGVVAETLGRVEQPLYTMRFKAEQDIKDRGLEKGKVLFYVIPHSSFVFTQPLKAVKGSDASNIHDEEVGDDDMEFSDDEAEAEHKRSLKLKRQGRLGEAGRGRGGSKGRGGRGNNRSATDTRSDAHGTAYGNGSLEMNYDDVEEGEEGYTPLSRPSNLHEMMDRNQSIPSINRPMPPPISNDRVRGRGRGGRDRGRRGGNNAFRGRGGFQQQQHQPHQNFPQSQLAGAYQSNGFQAPFPPPPPPMLAPQHQPYPGSYATSPMSPLPQQQFSFGNSFGGFQFSTHQPYPRQPMQQNQSFSPSAVQQFNPSYQAGGPPGGWQMNQNAVAEVQRQLEEMRKAASQGGQYPGR